MDQVEANSVWLVGAPSHRGGVLGTPGRVRGSGEGSLQEARLSLCLVLYKKHTLEHIQRRASDFMIWGTEVAGEETSWPKF